MTSIDRFERVEVRSRRELHSWLEEHHGQGDAVWLVTYKKLVPSKYLSTDEILDEILCFGWVDGVRRKLDDERTMQLIAPRRTQHWSQTYKDRVARLIDEGRMSPAGMKSVQDSKREGLWDFFADVDALVVPPDLSQALAAQSGATENFDTYPDSYKRNVLRWIKVAKTSPTRQRRVAEVARTAAARRRLAQF